MKQDAQKFLILYNKSRVAGMSAGVLLVFEIMVVVAHSSDIRLTVRSR